MLAFELKLLQLETEELVVIIVGLEKGIGNSLHFSALSKWQTHESNRNFLYLAFLLSSIHVTFELIEWASALVPPTPFFLRWVGRVGRLAWSWCLVTQLAQVIHFGWKAKGARSEQLVQVEAGGSCRDGFGGAIRQFRYPTKSCGGKAKGARSKG